MVKINDFIEKFSTEILEDNAAVFAGAGLSMSSGFVSWKELLRDIALELNLDIDKENDLIGIAQYHVNENRNRGQLNQRIIEKFTKDARESDAHNILARLPISIYWTTNYDTLIEDSLRRNNKKIDTKISQGNLAINIPKRDAVVYKMHGDVSRSDEAVITKDDYETYNEKRQLFTTILQGDLISKTFIFLGFSFEDPNLNYILSRIRNLLGENKRTHYALFRTVQKKDYAKPEDFEYSLIKQNLLIEDLKRYSINAVMIENYTDITKTLAAIEFRINKRNVFISGSAEEYGTWSQNDATQLIEQLTQKLIREDHKIITGFGYGIGSYIINSAVQFIDSAKFSHYDDYLRIRPFAFQLTEGEKKIFNTKYRTGIISECGISIFLFGNKKNGTDIVNADGVLEEYELSKEKGAIIIPVGTTGYASKLIYDDLFSDLSKCKNLLAFKDILGTSKDINQIVDSIIEIIRLSKTN
ncbi:MAG: SIR2 family protein [Ignavibacteriales bacterium]|nr:SIR2 family protein [Ignavibacteriales bacterium]